MDKDDKEILNLYAEYDTVYGPYLCGDGRKRVTLFNKETKAQTTRQLAKVRLEVKIGRKLIGKETVDHKDENKTNDDTNNLQVLSVSDNARKSSLGRTRTLGIKQTEKTKNKFRGEFNGLSKISNEKVKEFREEFFSGRTSKKEIINDSGLTRKSVENFLKGKSYLAADGPTSTNLKVGRPKKDKNTRNS